MVESNRLVQILLATYNGEKYVTDLIMSLMGQSYSDIQIVIRDDNSTDSTRVIISKLVEKFPDRIRVLTDNLGNIGSSRSFYELLKMSTAKYVMFCDQDDIWKNDKVSSSINLMLVNEFSRPLLVFTDLEVVDESMSLVHPSMLTQHRLNANYLCGSYLRMLAQNPVAGCTMLLNRTAVEKVLSFGEFPSSIVYDHWVAVLVAYFGVVCYLDQSSILYRQHGANQVGVKSIGFGYFLSKFIRFRHTLEHDKQFIQRLGACIDVPVVKYITIKVFLNLKRLLRYC